MVRKRSRVRVPPSAPASPQGEPRNTLHKPQGVCFNACGSASARVTRSATTKTPLNRAFYALPTLAEFPSRTQISLFPRHKFTQFRLFFSHCLQGFFLFPKPRNQLTKFNWLSEKRPLAVRLFWSFSIFYDIVAEYVLSEDKASGENYHTS